MERSQVQERARPNSSAVFKNIAPHIRRRRGNTPMTTDETSVLLDQIIEEAGSIHDVVPSNPAKEILSLISGLLSVVKDTRVKDMESFPSFVLQCDRAVQVLRPASNGGDAEVPLTEAKLAGLKMLLLRVHEDITSFDKRKRHWFWSRGSSTPVTKTEMDEWISRFDLLLSPEPRPVYLGATTLQKLFLDGSDKNDHNQPHALFGRDDIVKEIAHKLLAPHHISLCGPGGIGKTALSQAILNEPLIRERYKERRFFTHFDDFDSFQMTHELFINRLARALLVDEVNVAREWHIMNFLKLGHVLLVLDSVDCLVDAPSPESGRILNSLTEFALLPNVTIVMTTFQSNELPPSFKVPCIVYHVPPLPAISIHDAFGSIYEADGTPLAAEWLSTNNITNALAIHILAHVANANKWTAEQLRHAWGTVYARLSAGKLDAPQDLTLACSVEVSLNAPSAKCFRSDVRHAFAVLALLPQGLLKEPSRVVASLGCSPEPIELMDVLLKHGLLVPRGEFYVVNPSIRRYMRSSVPPHRLDAAFLKQVRGTFPYIISEADSRTAAFVREDVNTECVVAFNITHLDLPDVQFKQTFVHVARFVEALLKYKPRSTCLRDILSTLAHKLLSENLTLEPESRHDLEPLMRAFTVMSTYHRLIGDYVASADLFDMAHDIALAQNNGTVAMECLTHKAEAYQVLGRYQAAKEIIEQMRQSDLWAHGHPSKWGLASWVLAMCQLQLELKPENHHHLFIQAADHFKGETATQFTSKIARSFSAFSVGAVDGDWSAARGQVQEWLDADQDDQNHGPYLYGLVPITFMEGRLEEAQQYVSRARGWCSSKERGKIQANRMLAEEALIASHRGRFEEATDLLQQAASGLEEIGNLSPLNESIVLYASACNSLFANALADAKTNFERVRHVCAKRQELHLQAQSVRALGEVAFLDGDGEGARAYFDATAALCRLMGIPPSLLYRCHVLRDLGNKYTRWRGYLGN